MLNKPWTPDEISRLFDLIKEGKSFSQVAPEIGRSRSSCIGIYHRELVRRGHVPTPRPRSPRADTVEKRAYTPTIPKPQVPRAGVGFLLPTVAAPPPRTGPAVGILDITGCKWAVAEDASLAGGHAFCNAPRDGKSSYCSHHHAKAIDPVPRPVPKSLGAYGLRYGKAAA